MVEHRIVEGVTLDLENLDEPAVGKIVSSPDRWKAGNQRCGIRRLGPDRRNRLEQAKSSRRKPSSKPIISSPATRSVPRPNGRLQTLYDCRDSLCFLPEYITTIQPGSLFPDDERFGIFWMRRRQMEAAFDMEGAFNDVALSLIPGANEDEVIRRLDLLLENYGGLGAMGRDLHLSHRFISDELQQLKIMSIVPPSIFGAGGLPSQCLPPTFAHPAARADRGA